MSNKATDEKKVRGRPGRRPMKLEEKLAFTDNFFNFSNASFTMNDLL